MWCFDTPVRGDNYIIAIVFQHICLLAVMAAQEVTRKYSTFNINIVYFISDTSNDYKDTNKLIIPKESWPNCHSFIILLVTEFPATIHFHIK